MEKTKSCEERIEAELKDRLEDVREILKAEDPVEELNNISLSWNGYKLELSWDGPADGFKFLVDSEKNVCEIIYYFQDWFDGAERHLSGEDFDLLEELYNTCLNF